MANEEESYAPDPVAERAAKYAIEVTDTSNPHPVRNRLLIAFLALFIVIGTFGAAIGTINSVTLKHQNDLLQNEQTCQTQLLKAITEEQNARAQISSDDRSAQKAFNLAISKAKTAADRNAAQAAYNHALAVNDARRAKFPVPTFSNDVCNTKAGQVQVHNVHMSQSPSKGSGSTTSPTSVPSSGSSSSTHSVVVPKGSHSSVPTHSNPTPSKVSKAPQPKSTPTAKPTQPVKSSPAPLLPVPGCTVSVLGIRVC